MLARSLQNMGFRTRVLVAVLLVIPLVAVLNLARSDSARAAVVLPSKFQQTTLPFAGLAAPTSLAFSPDGRVFVAEKSGIVKVFSSLADTSSGTVFADLRKQVMNFLDRGLLGLALAPNFPSDPRVYVHYVYNAAIGAQAPKWPSNDGGTSENCPTPPGPNTDGCLVSGRVSVLVPADPASGARVGGLTEKVLLEDWCQQFPSHSGGTIAFGKDGMLYVSGGDGASYGYVDYGQTKNPCGDPPTKAGTPTTAPNGEGGALRSQDLLTPNDPTTLDGGIIRINPDSNTATPVPGGPAAGNPNSAGHDANAKRLIAEGLRNPYRFTFRPGTSELWVGDVGMNTWEEINRIPSPTAKVTNFGWPCYEGAARMPGYDAANLKLCEGLYNTGGASGPYFTYKHASKVYAADPATCTPGKSSSITGLAFYPGGPGTSYPPEYKSALFFTDYSRKCIWTMTAGTNGLPSPTSVKVFASGLSGGLVDLQSGPGGDIFGVDIAGGKIVRYIYNGVNNPPLAAIAADPTGGDVPLKVNFDASGSTDVNPNDILTYKWDLDGDGQWDKNPADPTQDLTGPQVSKTYDTKGKITAKVQVTDNHGAVDTAEALVTPGYSPPTVTIDSPTKDTTWKVGDPITYKATVTDQGGQPLSDGQLDWTEIIHHCPSDCHEHVVTHFYGAQGQLNAPDHEYPSYIELRLKATDAEGLTTTRSVSLYPQTVQVKLVTSPAGARVAFVDQAGAAPLERPEIIGSQISISAPQPQVLNDQVYQFGTWSGCDATPSTQATHNITIPNADVTCTAQFVRKPNLALKRPVKVSSTQSTAYPASYAVDGSMTTRWSSKFVSPQWLQVDLGSSKQVGRAVLRWEAAYGKAYKIQVSGDATTWTTVYTTASGNGGVDNLTFTARNARYVRFYGTTRATNYGYSPWEFEVYDG
ncbi:MAG: hypothetical protein QOE54_4674 [Streptosporangiaceae bacterium]|nr:hypothetical protein [Streptosporangiaceae bacterium]